MGKVVLVSEWLARSFICAGRRYLRVTLRFLVSLGQTGRNEYRQAIWAFTRSLATLSQQGYGTVDQAVTPYGSRIPQNAQRAHL